MPIKTEARFKSWSYTRWSDWNRCPAYAKYKHIDKRPEPKNEAMQRGADIAKAGEDYLTKRTPKLHPELAPVKQEFARLRKIKGLIVESQWGLTAEWEPVDYFDWDRCKLRSKIDVGYIANNILEFTDNKTGKFREEQAEGYELQLDLYVAAGIAIYPQLDGIRPRLLYTDLNMQYPQQPKIVTAVEARKKQKEWDKRFKPMIMERRWAPRPGNYCRWCPYRKAVGGPCKY